MVAHPVPDPPGPGEAHAVAEGVLWMRLPVPGPLGHVDVYALEEDGGWTLVDTGLDIAVVAEAWEVLAAGPLGGRPVTRVIVTHHHPDHVGRAGHFVARGAELLTSRTAWLMARMLTLDEQARPAPEALAFWRAAGMPAEMLAARADARPFNFADCVAPLPLGFTRLAEGDTLRAGGRVWDVAMGDGHAPEHVTLWSRDDDLVVGGDQFLASISPNLGVYPTEPGADTVGDWLAACRRFAARAEGRHLVLSGHKRPFTGLPARLSQKIDGHLAALDRLRAHLAEPRTAAECFRPVFGREIRGEAFGLALGEAVGHLNHLLALGEVCRRMRADGVWEWRRV